MGKTNLVASLTYFTKEEDMARKIAAKQAGLSMSNYNRLKMGYSTFKQGKPKQKIENNSVEKINEIDSENSISFNNSNLISKDLAEILLTENELENVLKSNEEIDKNILKIEEKETEQNSIMKPNKNDLQPSLF